MSDTLRKEGKQRTIKLLDGKDYAIPPSLNLNVQTAIENELDCSMTEIGEKLERRQAGTMHKILYVLIRRYLPKITFEQVGELVDTSNQESVANQLAEALSGE